MLRIVNLLFFCSDRVEDTDNQGNTALHAAAYTGHISLLKVIDRKKLASLFFFIKS